MKSSDWGICGRVNVAIVNPERLRPIFNLWGNWGFDCLWRSFYKPHTLTSTFLCCFSRSDMVDAISVLLIVLHQTSMVWGEKSTGKWRGTSLNSSSARGIQAGHTVCLQHSFLQQCECFCFIRLLELSRKVGLLQSENDFISPRKSETGLEAYRNTRIFGHVMDMYKIHVEIDVTSPHSTFLLSWNDK